MNFKDVYEKEHVTRKFTNRKLQEKTIAGIVKMAQQSPSLLNSQPWRAYVLMGDALSKFKAASVKKIDDKQYSCALCTFPCKVLCNQPSKPFGNGRCGTGIDDIPSNGNPANRQLCDSSANH